MLDDLEEKFSQILVFCNFYVTYEKHALQVSRIIAVLAKV